MSNRKMLRISKRVCVCVIVFFLFISMFFPRKFEMQNILKLILMQHVGELDSCTQSNKKLCTANNVPNLFVNVNTFPDFYGKALLQWN